MCMTKQLTKVDTMRCNLILTNKARQGVLEWSKDEHAFFKMQDSFDIHIEKRPVNSHGNTSLSLYFDNETNKGISEKIEGKVAVLECVLQNDGFLATGFHVKSSKAPVRTNRRLAVNLQFVTTRNNGAGLPLSLHTKIRDLPIAQERSEYVKKRITSWEGYLKVQERNATIDDISASYSRLTINEDFSRLTLVDSNLKADEWNKIKGLSVSLKGFQNDIGDVLKVDRSKKTIQIDLKPRFREMARKNNLHPKIKEAVFSNFATLSQIRRLRKGFEDLQNGLAANANLENILFENRPTIRVTSKKKDLVFHNQLNEFQQEAVVGAMSAEDLYVIQGPPGTGKTTVISEICQQNAKAGLRTLVASQSNLAVDNALSRLLSNQDIRILRFGRTESIEEEGKRFIEENVGQYWKEQTLSTLEEIITTHSTREAQLDEEIQQNTEQIESFENQLVSIQEKIKQKELAHSQQAVVLNDIKQLKKVLIPLIKEREELEKQQETLENALEELSKSLEQMEKFIESNPPVQELREQVKQLELETALMHNQIVFQQTIQDIKNAEKLISQTKEDYQQVLAKVSRLEEFIQAIPSIRKIDALKSAMHQYEVVPLSIVERQITQLDTVIETIHSFKDWEEVNTRLTSAIGYMEGLLKKHNVPLDTVNSNVISRGVIFDTTYSPKEIHQFIDIMKRFLTSDGMEVEKLEVYLAGLYVRRSFVWKQGTSLQKAKADSGQMYQTIKLGLEEQIRKDILTLSHHKNQLKDKGVIQNDQLTTLISKSTELQRELKSVENIPTLQQLEVQLIQHKNTTVELKKTEETFAKYEKEIEGKKKELQVLMTQSEENKEVLLANQKESKRINSEGIEKEKELRGLEEILKQQPEEEYKQVTAEIETVSEKLSDLQKQKVRLPITQVLQNEWFSLLKEANEHDLDEIRKLYVRHANVIGTTCVASARKEFMDNYPTFDVVIIDEVSKATPPELLLPMLKGKKIILVGDHHQLPPLVGEDTLDETLKAILEESDSFEEKDELKKLLKESLFERLFKNLPKSNKTMLAIQYRMHESIMETITPFYEEENYRLQCGLVDSDSVRDHLLESSIVQRKDHLLWLNLPNERPYFEEKVKDGKSRFNQAELDTIRKVLIDLDKATATAKLEGRMKPEEKKSIGVISFYGEQVKRIDRLLQQETNLKHLTFRTGTVDKFQGMEMDVILLSMVRNNKDNNGDIGFANDYRRLNVALSRARELLVLVGSVEMFTERAKRKESRNMYSRLLQIVKKKNGLRNHN